MLKREATYFSPNLILTNDSLHISGRLWMENAQVYFEDVFLLTKKSTAKQFTMSIAVEHLNSSSIKQLLLYFMLLKEMADKKIFDSLKVSWNISEDDHELREVVNDLAQVSDINITIGISHSENTFPNL